MTSDAVVFTRNLPHMMFRLITLFLSAALFLTGCTRGARSSRHLQRGEKYFAAGQYAKAEIEYLNALQLVGTNSAAIARLGFIYYEQGRFGRAFAFLSKAKELTPGDLELRVKLASIYLAGGKAKEAREEINVVLDKAPTHPEAPVLLAESVTTRSNLSQVQSRLDKLSAQVGETAPLALARGVLEFREGNTNAAESFHKALALDPKSSAAHYALGNLAVAQNDLKTADAELKAAADLAPPRSSRRISYAEFKIRRGELIEGKLLLAEISKETPDYLPAWVRQAEIALAEKDFTNCASLLNQALARDPGNYDALLLMGRLLLAQGDASKAVSQFEKTTKVYENSAPAHYFLALAHLLNKDVSKALKSLNQSVTLDPNYAEAVLALAELNINKGNVAPAITALTQLAKRRPQIPQAHLLLANAYLVQKNLDEAAAVYNRMLTMFPKSPQVPLFLGIVLAEQKKPLEARKAFAKSLELAPDFLLAHEKIIDLDLADKQYEAALDRATKQVEKNVTNAIPNLLLAKIHMARAQDYAREAMNKLPAATRTNIPLSALPETQSDVTQAETVLLKAIDLDPNLQTAYLLLSQLYVAANKHQEALTRLTGLVAKTNNIAALMQIGMIQDELKNYPAARDAYEKLLQINPKFTPALNNLAYLYCEPLQDLEKAYRLGELARQLQPADPVMADTFGWIMFKRGEYRRALGLIQEGAARLTEDPEVQYHLGMSQYMLGEEDAARTALQRALQLPKDFRGKEDAKKRIEILAIDPATIASDAIPKLESKLQADPNDPILAGRLASIYERQGAMEKAAKTYEAVLKQNPQNVQILSKLAALYHDHLKDPRKAFDFAKEAHTLAPEDAGVSLMLGRLVFEQGDYKWALNLLEEASRKFPDRADSCYDLARAYYNMGKVDEAESALQKAIDAGSGFSKLEETRRFLNFLSAAKDPGRTSQVGPEAQQLLLRQANYLPAIMVSGLFEQQQGHAGKAQEMYEKAVGINPLFTPATRQLGLLLALDPRQEQRAYDLLLKVRQAYPDDPEIARALGLIAFQRKDDTRATQLLGQCAESRKDDADLRYFLGIAHYRLKHRTEAKAALEQALALNVQNKFATEAKRVLAELK